MAKACIKLALWGAIIGSIGYLSGIAIHELLMFFIERDYFFNGGASDGIKKAVDFSSIETIVFWFFVVIIFWANLKIFDTVNQDFKKKKHFFVNLIFVFFVVAIAYICIISSIDKFLFIAARNRSLRATHDHLAGWGNMFLGFNAAVKVVTAAILANLIVCVKKITSLQSEKQEHD